MESGGFSDRGMCGDVERALFASLWSARQLWRNELQANSPSASVISCGLSRMLHATELSMLGVGVLHLHPLHGSFLSGDRVDRFDLPHRLQTLQHLQLLHSLGATEGPELVRQLSVLAAQGQESRLLERFLPSLSQSEQFLLCMEVLTQSVTGDSAAGGFSLLPLPAPCV